MAAIVTLDSVAVGFGVGASEPVLRNVSVSLDRGEFVVVFGASGVGKSTLLRVIAGLLPPRSGSVTSTSTNRFGFVFQDPRLFPWRRCICNVTFGLEGGALTRAERVERGRELMRLVGVAPHEGRFPAQLSGGQRQRVGIARALAVNPDVLLMDEPFGALDAVTRSTLQQELLGIWRRTGTSILFVTHDIDEAVYLADRIILLAGSPAQIVREYRPGMERPRMFDDPEFRRLAGEIRHDLDAFQDTSGP